MFGINNINILNRRVPKTAFYKNANFSTRDKDVFTNVVDNITLLYSLSDTNVYVSKGSYVDEILIFLINLREDSSKNDILKISALIDNSMPAKKNIYVFNINSRYIVSIGYKKDSSRTYVVSDEYRREEDLVFQLNGTNLDQIYENLIGQFTKGSIVYNNNEPFSDYLERFKRIEELEKQVNLLTSKRKKIKQLNKQIKISDEIRAIQKEIDELKREN